MLGLVILAPVLGARVKIKGAASKSKPATDPIISGFAPLSGPKSKSLNRVSAVVAYRDAALTGQKSKMRQIRVNANRRE